MNRPAAAAATILLVEDNFGCGSSREGAVYALVDHGIRALIGPSFGDIFYNNALKNGLVPVRLPEADCQRLVQHLAAFPDAKSRSIWRPPNSSCRLISDGIPSS